MSYETIAPMSTTMEPETPTTNGEFESEVEYISFRDLEAEYLKNRDLETEQRKCGKLIFRKGGEEITDLAGYNPTQPIYDTFYDPGSGKPYFILGVRMEKRNDESNSRIVYFRAATPFSKEWDLIEDEELPEINGQDPSITKIGGQLLFSAVEVKPVPDESGSSSRLEWHTAFYIGKGVADLERFAEGPLGMKVIRPVEIPTGQVIIFTRPQNPGNEALGGRGQIGEITADSIEAIKDPNILQNAPFINTRFLPEEWGGINYAVALKDGRVGVIGHIARLDQDKLAYEGQKDNPKIYCPFSGIYNPVTRRIENIKIEAMSDEFKGAVAKNEFVEDVVYTTAMTDPDENGNVMLIQGVGDAETWSKEIEDPFAGLRHTNQDYLLAA